MWDFPGRQGEWTGWPLPRHRLLAWLRGRAAPSLMATRCGVALCLSLGWGPVKGLKSAPTGGRHPCPASGLPGYVRWTSGWTEQCTSRTADGAEDGLPVPKALDGKPF